VRQEVAQCLERIHKLGHLAKGMHTVRVSRPA
jgi:hypothetical protein